MPTHWSQAQIEAQTVLNGAQPGQTYEVVNTKGQVIYRFTIPSAKPANSGWALGLGVADQFVAGAGSKNRHYGPASTQALNMKASLDYRDMLRQIAAGQTHGRVSTNRAFWNTRHQFRDGTQAQLGAFTWRFTDPVDVFAPSDVVGYILALPVSCGLWISSLLLFGKANKRGRAAQMVSRNATSEESGVWPPPPGPPS